MGNLSQLGAVVRPRVRANVDPAVMEALGRLRQQMLQQAALDDAARMDEFFGRVPPKDPNAGIMAALDDPLSEMIGATGAPRRMLEAGEFRRAVDEGMTPAEPLADMLNRANRTNTLLESRVNRLSPEEQQGSLAAVWMQAQRDAADAARARRAADARNSADMQTGAAIAGLGALGAGAFGARVAQEAARNAEQSEPLAMPEPEAVIADPEPQPTWWGEMEEDIVPPSMDIGEDVMGDMLMEMVDDEVAPYEPEIALNPGDEALVDSVLNSPVPDWYSKRTIREYAMPLGMLSADEAVEMAPGPESQVTETDFNIEDLPGPQQRSLKALMNSGIPEGRARDIILRGSSMSPDEYRLVTGGRR